MIVCLSCPRLRPPTGTSTSTGTPAAAVRARAGRLLAGGALVLGLILGSGGGSDARADEIEEAIRAALTAYQAGDIATTREELTYAVQVLSQVKAEGLAGYLPQAQPGWTREDVDTQAMGSAFMGGGLMAQASYHRDGDTVDITLMADNPMVASMAGLFSTPGLAGAMGQVTRINRQTVIVTPDGELQTLVNNRVLIQITGTASAGDKEAYMAAIDVNALKDF